MTTPITPVIDANGISGPDFATIFAYFQDQYRSIFGIDAVISPDSQDGQFIAVVSQALADFMAALVATRNSFSPSTAQGNGLSSVVKINGLARLIAAFSTVDLTIVGVAGTVITNGQAQDTNGNVWNLPASVTIPIGGSILVTATAAAVGAVSAGVGTVTKIKTPVFGWQSVTNAAASTVGAPVESDAALRVRQSVSTSQPSQSVFEGIVSAVANLPGVTRIKGYENNTASTDANGIPRNSIALIVDGGDSTLIAQTIANKITPGTGTFGVISQVVTDQFGSTHTIAFSRSTQALIKVAVTIDALTGYSSQIQDLVEAAIVAYINGLSIGQNVVWTRLFVPANLLNTQFSQFFNVTTLTIAKNAGSPGTVDLAIAYNEAPFADLLNTTFTIV